MARKAIILGILIYVVQLFINNLFYKIPEPVYISVLVIACALMLFGVFMDNKMRQKDGTSEKTKNIKQK